MYLVRTELKRAMTSIPFLLGMLGVFFVGLTGCLETVLMFQNKTHISIYRGNVYFLSAWSSALHSKGFLTLLPILGAIPYAASFFEEWNSRFFVFYAIREKKYYIPARLCAVWLSGGACVAAGIALLLFVLSLLMPLDVTQTEIFSENRWDMLSSCVMECVRLSLNGSFWALVGNFSSLIGKHLYLVWLVPFSSCYIMETFQKRYFSEWYILSPWQWATGTALGPKKSILWILGLNLAVILACGIVMKRRISDG